MIAAIRVRWKFWSMWLFTKGSRRGIDQDLSPYAYFAYAARAALGDPYANGVVAGHMFRSYQKIDPQMPVQEGRKGERS